MDTDPPTPPSIWKGSISNVLIKLYGIEKDWDLNKLEPDISRAFLRLGLQEGGKDYWIGITFGESEQEESNQTFEWFMTLRSILFSYAAIALVSVGFGSFLMTTSVNAKSIYNDNTPIIGIDSFSYKYKLLDSEITPGI